MANTSSRTLRLLSLLQTHRFWPGEQLADRLGVSPRTLRRDIERLRELGYPVASTRGTEGGYQLEAGGSLPPLAVEEDEAIAMVVALGRTASSASGDLADSTLSALSKVMQVLPARLRRRAEALRAVTVDSPFDPAPEIETSVLATLAQAIRDAERVRFEYTARGGAAPGQQMRRHVEPVQLVTVGRHWYLVAFDVERGDWRSFRLDRLHAPSGTKARFRPRSIPGGDAVSFVRAGLRRAEQGQVTVAVVRAPAADVRELIGRWAEVRDIDAGSCEVELEARDPRWIPTALGMTGAEFELRSAPDEVLEELRSWTNRFATAAR